MAHDRRISLTANRGRRVEDSVRRVKDSVVASVFAGWFLVLCTPSVATAALPVRPPPSPVRPPPSAVRSPVTTELFKYDCRSENAREEITLFGNGTLRLRQGLLEHPSMFLLELAPPDLEDLKRRIGRLDLEEAQAFGGTLEGEWVGQCVLEVSVAEGPLLQLSFHQFDALSLGVQRAVDLGLELIDRVRLNSTDGGLPPGYEAKIGDYLRHLDGQIFEVVGFTSEGRGIELHGVEQPLGLFVATQDLRRVFVALEERR